MSQTRLAEQSVLGAITLDQSAPSVFHRVAGIVTVDDFLYPEHRVLWSLIAELVEKGSPLDVVALGEIAEDRKIDESVGGIGYLIEISNNTPGVANAEWYARAVRDEAIKRAINSAGHRIAQIESKGAQAIDDAHSILGSLAARSVASSVDMKTAMKAVYSRMEERFSGVKLPVTPTPWSGLNAMLGGGLGHGKLYIVGGRPGMGKTAWMRGAAVSAAEHGHACIISLEMDREEVGGMMLAGASGVDYQHIRDPQQLPQDDWGRITAGMIKLNALPISICDMPGLSLPSIASEARRLSAKSRLSIVVIDYLGLMELPDADRQDIAIGKITRGLKMLARELNVPVVLLCQLSRKVEERANKRPLMSDLRDAGQIEQDADGIVFLYRDKYYNAESEFGDVAEMNLAKQRAGRTGVVPVVFRAEQVAFCDYYGEWPITPAPKQGGGFKRKAA